MEPDDTINSLLKDRKLIEQAMIDAEKSYLIEISALSRDLIDIKKELAKNGWSDR